MGGLGWAGLVCPPAVDLLYLASHEGGDEVSFAVHALVLFFRLRPQQPVGGRLVHLCSTGRDREGTERAERGGPVRKEGIEERERVEGEQQAPVERGRGRGRGRGSGLREYKGVHPSRTLSSASQRLP